MGLTMDASLEIHSLVEVSFGFLYFYSYVMENSLMALDVDVNVNVDVKEKGEMTADLVLVTTGGYGF